MKVLVDIYKLDAKLIELELLLEELKEQQSENLTNA